MNSSRVADRLVACGATLVAIACAGIGIGVAIDAPSWAKLFALVFVGLAALLTAFAIEIWPCLD